MDESKRLAYLFRRYFDKSCTAGEKDELFDLLLRAEHDETLRKLIEETWSYDIPSYLQDNETADRILEHIIHLRPPASEGELLRRPSTLYRLRHTLSSFHYMRYAAVLFGVTLVAVIIYHFHHNPPSPTPTAVISRNLAMTPAPDAAQCVTLSDGSKVLLHKDAHIDYDYQKVLTGATREVTLHGEAYFDIRKGPRPFIVHTGNIRTTVLGTAFNINAPNDRTITITVTKGKVKVENDAGEFSILRRNEQLSVDSMHTQLKKMSVNAGEILSWKKPYLLFNDVTMKEAMQELEQRYHVAFLFTNPAAENCPVTASFTGGESFEEIIKVLSKINNMTYSMHQGMVEITGEGCK